MATAGRLPRSAGMSDRIQTALFIACTAPVAGAALVAAVLPTR